MSEDPIGFRAKDPNFYRYVGNNPVKYTDPTGTELSFGAAIGIGAVVRGIAGGVGEMIGNDNWTWGSVGDGAIGGGVGGAMTVVGAGTAIVGAGVSIAGAAGAALFGITTGAAVNLIMDPSTIPSPIKPHVPKDPVQCGGGN